MLLQRSKQPSQTFLGFSILDLCSTLFSPNLGFVFVHFSIPHWLYPKDVWVLPKHACSISNPIHRGLWDSYHHKLERPFPKSNSTGGLNEKTIGLYKWGIFRQTSASHVCLLQVPSALFVTSLHQFPVAMNGQPPAIQPVQTVEKALAPSFQAVLQPGHVHLRPRCLVTS